MKSKIEELSGSEEDIQKNSTMIKNYESEIKEFAEQEAKIKELRATKPRDNHK